MYRIGRVRLYIAIIVTILLESTILNLISVGDIRPNIVLLLVIFLGLYSDWKGALEAGVVGGLLRGIISTGPIGVNIVIFGLSGLVVSYCKDKVYKENLFAQILLTLILAMGVNIATIFSKFVIGDTHLVDIDPWRIIIFPLITISLYTSLLAVPLFFFLKRMFRVKELRF